MCHESADLLMGINVAAPGENAAVTDLLARWAEGDRRGLDAAVEALYSEIRSICARAVSREGIARPLQPTELLSEVYLRLQAVGHSKWENRNAFLGFFARISRHVLVEEARAMRSLKRGGPRQRVELDSSALAVDPRAARVDVLDLESALVDLEDKDPRLATLVELRYYADLSEREAAVVMGLSRATVQRHWRMAKHFLAVRLGESTQRSSDLSEE